MRISEVLRVKGAHVVTVPPDTTVRRLLAVAEHRIGAVVISADDAPVDGENCRYARRFRSAGRPDCGAYNRLPSPFEGCRPRGPSAQPYNTR